METLIVKPDRQLGRSSGTGGIFAEHLPHGIGLTLNLMNSTGMLRIAGTAALPVNLFLSGKVTEWDASLIGR